MKSIDCVYARGNLGEAVEILITAHGDVRQRLTLAFERIAVLTVQDFPPHLRKEWEWIVAESTKCGPQIGQDGKVWRGSVANTMFRRRCSTASEIAKRIWTLYCEMNHFIATNEDLAQPAAANAGQRHAGCCLLR